MFNLNNLGFNEPKWVSYDDNGEHHRHDTLIIFSRWFSTFFGGFFPSTPGIPQYATTLTGEDMCSDVNNRPCGF